MSLLVCGALFGGTFFLLFLARMVGARSEHREGPGRHGKTNYSQVWSDFLKVRRKSRDAASSFPARFHVVLYGWAALPALFLLVLFSPIVPEALNEAELPLLLLLPLVAAAGEALFLHATK